YNARAHALERAPHLDRRALAGEQRPVDGGGALLGRGGLARPEQRRGGLGQQLARPVVPGTHVAVAAARERVGGPVHELGLQRPEPGAPDLAAERLQRALERVLLADAREL